MSFSSNCWSLLLKCTGINNLPVRVKIGGKIGNFEKSNGNGKKKDYGRKALILLTFICYMKYYFNHKDNS